MDKPQSQTPEQRARTIFKSLDVAAGRYFERGNFPDEGNTTGLEVFTTYSGRTGTFRVKKNGHNFADVEILPGLERSHGVVVEGSLLEFLSPRDQYRTAGMETTAMDLI